VTALREKKPEVAREELAELVREFPRNAFLPGSLRKLKLLLGRLFPYCRERSGPSCLAPIRYGLTMRAGSGKSRPFFAV